MKLINRLERALGKFAIPHLITYIIAAYAIGFVLELIGGNFLYYLTLEPYYILKGQIWRLVSWIFIPDTSGIWALIMMIFYYQIGTELEHYWGTFRFNLYIWGGIFFTDIAALILYAVTYQIYKTPYPVSFMFGTSYINLSMFLAFATCFPEEKVMLYFVIPVKMKWLAVVYAAISLYTAIVGGWIVRTAIIASLLNFIIFYLLTRNTKQYSPREIHRKQKFKRQVHQSEERTKHKCAVCGRTEEDGPDLQFRYCSKCDGNHEYCQDHLFTHQHIKLH
ncbi:MAG: hypothetical protein E7280_08985 [Lachnospiraceae bacterium]|jgi:hypothetical protein|nr:hypothetical protein [Lachnospiraceae bacterium]